MSNTSISYNPGSYGSNPFDTLKNYIDKLIASVRGSVSSFPRTIIADVPYTLQSSDSLIAFTTLTTTRAVTLPAAASVSGRRFLIKDESGNAGTSNITITGTVDGVTNKAITTAYGVLRIYSNGIAYFTW